MEKSLLEIAREHSHEYASPIVAAVVDGSRYIMRATI